MLPPGSRITGMRQSCCAATFERIMSISLQSGTAQLDLLMQCGTALGALHL
jgi:hypothetical protein